MILSMVALENLSDAEKKVQDAFPAGRAVNFSTGNEEEDNPAGGESWGPARPGRAGRVEPGQQGEINLKRARVVGKLRLPGATLQHGLRLNECYLGDGVDLSE